MIGSFNLSRDRVCSLSVKVVPGPWSRVRVDKVLHFLQRVLSILLTFQSVVHTGFCLRRKHKNRQFVQTHESVVD